MENQIDNTNGEGFERSVANQDTSIFDDMPKAIDVSRLLRGIQNLAESDSHFDPMNWIFIALFLILAIGVYLGQRYFGVDIFDILSHPVLNHIIGIIQDKFNSLVAAYQNLFN